VEGALTFVSSRDWDVSASANKPLVIEKACLVGGNCVRRDQEQLIIHTLERMRRKTT
jgi:hypothetical protein